MQVQALSLPLMRINHILISHLHGDHYLGLMGLLFSMHLHHREHELHVYSPAGLDEILLAQLKHSRSALRFRLIFHKLNPHLREVIYTSDKLTVETLPLQHKLPCCGFLFREKEKPRRIDKERLPPGLTLLQLAGLKQGLDVVTETGELVHSNASLTLAPRKSRTYAYCSDTAYEPLLIPLIQGVDLLYHEATFVQQDGDKARETLHSTATEAARIALEAGVWKLIIGHFSARYRELDALLQEARAVFPETQLATEGQTFHIDE